MPLTIPRPPTAAGTTLTFSFDPKSFFVKVDPNAPLYVGFLNSITNVTFVEATKASATSVTAPVPEGATGVAFAVLSTFSGGLSGNQLSEFGTLAGPAEVVLS